jgi:3-deoxy-7-phosphoheptulonate synthase
MAMAGLLGSSVLPTTTPLKTSVFGNGRASTGSQATMIRAVHAAEPLKAGKSAVQTSPLKALTGNSWSVESWKTKKALQLPEYPNKEELDSVLQTMETFPPIVFAGEARHLEERIAEAAMGKAFLLQGGDCAESFKEFNAVNIRDTFRILLQMGVVMMFGGQMPVIKVSKVFAWIFLWDQQIDYNCTKNFLV